MGAAMTMGMKTREMVVRIWRGCMVAARVLFFVNASSDVVKMDGKWFLSGNLGHSNDVPM